MSATFSTDFPFAYHVVPLHALKSILSLRKLLSKSDLAARNNTIRRSTTAELDGAMGLASFVHFYLPKTKTTCFKILPILDTQLRESNVTPFPHAVIVIPTQPLNDSDCAICNFNVGISRPAYLNVGGGGHARGMSPQNVLHHWKQFKNSNPTDVQMRKSYWHDGIHVPLLMGKQITDCPAGIGYRASKINLDGRGIPMPELLMCSPFVLPLNTSLVVFSPFDARTIRLLDLSTIKLETKVREFEWYSESDRVEPDVRSAIDRYFRNESDSPSLDFDRRRPKLCNRPKHS